MLCTSKKTARFKRQTTWASGRHCPICGFDERYIHDDRCATCARKEALFFHEARHRGLELTEVNGEYLIDLGDDGAVVTTSGAVELEKAWLEAHGRPTKVFDGIRPMVSSKTCRKGHLGLLTPDGVCFACLNAPTNQDLRQRAIEAGEPTFKATAPCSRHPEQWLRHTHNGRCVDCHVPHPRLEAKRKGRETFEGDPCPVHAGHTTRLTRNGRCSKCCKPKPQVETTPSGRWTRKATQRYMDGNLNLTMRQRDARKLGIPVYRTGKPCPRGHVDWRFTSGGACVACRRSKE